MTITFLVSFLSTLFVIIIILASRLLKKKFSWRKIILASRRRPPPPPPPNCAREYKYFSTIKAYDFLVLVSRYIWSGTFFFELFQKWLCSKGKAKKNGQGGRKRKLIIIFPLSLKFRYGRVGCHIFSVQQQTSEGGRSRVTPTRTTNEEAAR